VRKLNSSKNWKTKKNEVWLDCLLLDHFIRNEISFFSALQVPMQHLVEKKWYEI
jgi:hypothetical protein